MFKKITLLLVLFIGHKSIANNIQLSNIILTGQNTTDNFTMVQFNLTWENSWRVSSSPSNWDAAWVFVKYRVGTGPWLHAFLNNSGHTTGTGTATTITPGLMNTANAFNATTNPSMGAFVHRSGDGAGAFTQTGLQLRWNYGGNSIGDDQVVDIKVFAVEMVYVPGGSFQVGDGTTNLMNGQFRNGSSTNTPLTISSEGFLTLGGAANGNLANNVGMQTSDDFNNTTTQNLPAAFPKGFNAFYCMKYEISQGQYRDFLNVLAYAQQVSRTAVVPTSGAGTGALKSPNADRNGLDIQTPGSATTFVSAVYGSNLDGDANYNESLDGENIPCNFLTWMDAAAFADWASLRPMTEMEFEKACRGTVTPVADEYAWGQSSHSLATGISNSGANNEVALNTGANIVANNHTSVQGPLRVGSFATASSTRAQAGASYYGIMELSGNLWERTVSVGDATGRNFTSPIHGNGLLTSDGFCDIATWPGFVTDKVTGAAGAGMRGGAWNRTYFDSRVSDRDRASDFLLNRGGTIGFRAVRSVP